MQQAASMVDSVDLEAPAAPIRSTMAAIASFCVQQRVDVTQEISAQIAIEQALIAGGFEFHREHFLSKRDKPDFLIIKDGFSIVLEMKTKANRMATYKQLERYASHEEVHGLILLSGTAMGLPAEINGKPAQVVSLGRAWLR